MAPFESRCNIEQDTSERYSVHRVSPRTPHRDDASDVCRYDTGIYQFFKTPRLLVWADCLPVSPRSRSAPYRHPHCGRTIEAAGK